MAKMLAIKTKGSKGVLAKLAALDNGVQSEVLETAVRVGSQLVEGEARRLAPEGATGKLRGSIKSETVEVTPGRALARVTVDEYYGRFHEFGTSKMPARPFLRPALRANRVRVLSTVRATIGRILRGRYGI